MKVPLLLGHRGVRLPGGPPENTFAAFDAALSAGCDGFEFDVRLTADGVPVVVHDPQHAGRDIARTRAVELNLATLDDVVSRYSQRAFLYIELKVPGLERHAARVIAGTSFPKGVLVASFLPDVLTCFHSQNASVPLGFIFDRAKAGNLWRKLPATCIIPEYPLVNRSLLDEVHGSGRQLFTWTVNHSRDMLRLAEMGVDGIVSDDPQRLVATLRS
jgi:glycerophosphoryl diester phosphodiesterase